MNTIQGITPAATAQQREYEKVTATTRNPNAASFQNLLSGAMAQQNSAPWTAYNGKPTALTSGSTPVSGVYSLPMSAQSIGQGIALPSMGLSLNSASESSASTLLPAAIDWPAGQDVSLWPETVGIQVKHVGNGKISWDEVGDRSLWPDRDGTNANAWLIRETAPGQYKAETWEYVRPGQTTKNTINIEELEDAPRSGDRVGIMLAGITRNRNLQNIQARSNIDWITWP